MEGGFIYRRFTYRRCIYRRCIYRRFTYRRSIYRRFTLRCAQGRLYRPFHSGTESLASCR